jgi:hypothetical protein
MTTAFPICLHANGSAIYLHIRLLLKTEVHKSGLLLNRLVDKT